MIQITNSTTKDGDKISLGGRKFAMGAIVNGMALHKGVTPVVDINLMHTDSLRTALKMTGLMKQQVIYVMDEESPFNHL